MLVAIKDIKPNPFRHLDRYPINEEKVETLRESIRTTEFWDNIVARKANGSVEIAYGHHRLKALRLEYDEDHKVNLIIRNLDDGTMIQIMARENMDEWESNVLVEQETIRATIQAFADDRIQFETLPKDTRQNYLRYAPSFLNVRPDVGPRRVYTMNSLGKFLGWLTKPEKSHKQGKPTRRLERSIKALELIERGVLAEDDFAGLGGHAAWEMIRQVQAAIDRHGDNKKGGDIARRIGNKIAEQIKAGDAGPNKAGDIARKVDPKAKEIPDIGAFTSKLGVKLEKVLHDDSLKDNLQQVCDNLDYLDEDTKFELAATLDGLAERARAFANQLGVVESTKMIGVSQ